MRLSIKEAGSLEHALMCANGHGERDAAVITDHIIDCELHGSYFGALSRAPTTPTDELIQTIADYSTLVRGARASLAVHRCGCRWGGSAVERRQRLSCGWLDVPEPIYITLQAALGEPPSADPMWGNSNTNASELYI